MSQLTESFTFYRIFVFHSTNNQIDLEELASKIEKRISEFDSNTLIVNCDTKDGNVELKRILKKDDVIPNLKTFIHQNQHSEATATRKQTDIGVTSLFEQIYGEYERRRPISIRAYLYYEIKSDYLKNYPDFHTLFLANYFVSALNTSNIYMTYIFGNDTYLSSVERFVEQKQSRQYKEFIVDYAITSVEHECESLLINFSFFR